MKNQSYLYIFTDRRCNSTILKVKILWKNNIRYIIHRNFNEKTVLVIKEDEQGNKQIYISREI